MSNMKKLGFLTIATLLALGSPATAAGCASSLTENPTVSQIIECLIKLDSEETLSRGGTVIGVTYASQNGPNDTTDDGRVASRVLRFQKIEKTSEVRIVYSDNLRVTHGSKWAACRWTVTVDGIDCGDRSIHTDRHDEHSASNHTHSTIIGYCSELSIGLHTVHVWVSPTPADNNKYGGSDCYTGWDNSLWTLEATELVANGPISE